MTTTSFGFAIEYVQDIDAARRFYVEVVGLAVQREHPTFVQFDSFAVATDEAMGPGRGRELYWLVDDAARALEAIGDRAEVAMPLKREAFGEVFGITGPAGEPVYLLQLSRDRPSRAVE